MPNPFPRRDGAPRPRSLRLPASTRLRWALLGMVVAALAGSPFAIGAALSSHKSVIAGTRTPITGTVKTPTTLATNTSAFGLAVTNASNRGGSAALSCGSLATGRRNACLRAANTASGRAFEFAFTGALGGMFLVGSDIDRPFPKARPFVTNATGVATGLNADRVDGLHAQDIIDSAVAKSSVQVGAPGPQGAQGPQGQRGEQGPQGQSGPPGTPLVAAVSTPVSATIGYGNRRVVDLPNRVLASQEPAAATDGADLLPGKSIVLDPGTYVVQTTFRGFDLGSERSDPADVQYGVAGLFLDGQLQSTMWTANIPLDGNNGALASDTTVISVPGSGGVVTLRGVNRQDVTASGGSTAEGGATVIVTGVNTG